MTANDLRQLGELLIEAAEKMTPKMPSAACSAFCEDARKSLRRSRKALQSVNQAKIHLKKLGWSQRRAAKKLGVRQEHLNLVLNGKRTSARLLLAISTLPTSPVPYRMVGFAVR